MIPQIGSKSSALSGPNYDGQESLSWREMKSTHPCEEGSLHMYYDANY